MSQLFALIGAAGYIAPRHMKAIKETGNTLSVAMDRSDNVGIIDSYFPNADFFLEFERFDRHVDKLRRKGNGHKIDYVSICSPNYLHDSHIRFALKSGANAICEKPLVLNPWNIDGLLEIEKETGKKISTVLQLRHHPAIQKFRDEYSANNAKKIKIDLTYITSRGKWYDYSWKGQLEKSGGVATNIGIHFFDMLSWVFGAHKSTRVHLSTPHKAGGYIDFANAEVRWLLSIDERDLPKEISQKGQRTYRSIQVEGKELEFSEGFTDLHTVSYREILAGRGYGPKDALESIILAQKIRNSEVSPFDSFTHPLVKIAKENK